VLLFDSSSGELLEGLVSNFFVIADEAELQQMPSQDAAAGAAAASDDASIESSAGAHSHAASSSSSGTAGLVLLTAGPAHAALPGIFQTRVLQACEQLQLKVLQQPARLQQQQAWREAFLTNW
jgi:branched-subunit amino acid aminotransferase/4-amino-4-deoxychorismate lyase